MASIAFFEQVDQHLLDQTDVNLTDQRRRGKRDAETNPAALGIFRDERGQRTPPRDAANYDGDYAGRPAIGGICSEVENEQEAQGRAAHGVGTETPHAEARLC
jgi:hypothetical protein